MYLGNLTKYSRAVLKCSPADLVVKGRARTMQDVDDCVGLDPREYLVRLTHPRGIDEASNEDGSRCSIERLRSDRAR